MPHSLWGAASLRADRWPPAGAPPAAGRALRQVAWRPFAAGGRAAWRHRSALASMGGWQQSFRWHGLAAWLQWRQVGCGTYGPMASGCVSGASACAASRSSACAVVVPRLPSAARGGLTACSCEGPGLAEGRQSVGCQSVGWRGGPRGPRAETLPSAGCLYAGHPLPLRSCALGACWPLLAALVAREAGLRLKRRHSHPSGCGCTVPREPRLPL